MRWAGVEAWWAAARGKAGVGRGKAGCREVGGTRDGLPEGARWVGPRGLREAGRFGDGFGPFFLSFFIFFSHA